MKLSSWETGILVICALFAGFMAGRASWDRRPVQPLRVEAQRRLEVEVTAFPAPTFEEAREKININTAGAEELESLPGIGEKRAADIIADRAANGPFRFPEDLVRVKGIGEDTLGKLMEYITTEDEP